MPLIFCRSCNGFKQPNEIKYSKRTGSKCLQCIDKGLIQLQESKSRIFRSKDKRVRIREVIRTKIVRRAKGVSNNRPLRGKRMSLYLDRIMDTITFPERCPYLDIELNYFHSDCYQEPNTASIDRIDSSKGYELGNIQIISFLANKLKNNATQEQLITFAKNILKMYCKDSI